MYKQDNGSTKMGTMVYGSETPYKYEERLKFDLDIPGEWPKDEKVTFWCMGICETDSTSG